VALGDGIMLLVGNPIFLTLVKCVRVPSAALLGCVLLLPATACPYASSATLALILNYVPSLGAPMAFPAVSAIVSQVAPPHRRGAWTGMTIAAQGLGRTVGPIVFGYVWDVDERLAYWVLGASAACAALCCLLLVPRVPMVGPAAASRSDIMQGPPQCSIGAEEMLCEGLVASLQQRRRYWEDQLDLIRAGGEQVLPPPASAMRRREAKRELVEWFVDLLESRGYVNWAEYMEGIKLMLSNAFPKLRRDSPEQKVSDVLHVYDAHMHMAEKTAGLMNHM